MTAPAEQILLEALIQIADSDWKSHGTKCGLSGDVLRHEAREAVAQYNKLKSEPVRDWPSDSTVEAEAIARYGNGTFENSLSSWAEKKAAFKAGVAWVKEYMSK